MIVLAGGDLVLPDRILTAASLVIEGTQIAAIEASARVDTAGATVIDATDCYVVPGFIDVHVHGVEGYDTLDGDGAVAEIASRLPRYGVTAFCPTTVACAPSALEGVLEQVRTARVHRSRANARVLPAHLESNFINPEYRGAQPGDCLRMADVAGRSDSAARKGPSYDTDVVGRPFTGRHILELIANRRADVGIVTLAPELPGGIELVKALVSAGHIVSIGHTGANFDEAIAAIEAGASHATHLFNRMSPIGHRDPGVAGAVLSRQDVVAELICDGHHVHPAMCRLAITAKGVDGIVAITDGTAGAGLAPGSRARLGGREIRVTEQAAVLDDGTLAGSTLTMDRAFKAIVSRFEFSLVDAAALCSLTPARQLGLAGFGFIAEGGIADLVVLDRGFRVVRTMIDGQEAYRSGAVA
jgi:N-acetylglucosamine-6-phosphate deacetylase